MKKFTLLAIISMASLFAFADNHTQELNPNITPFHDASEVNDGFNFMQLRNQVAWKNFQSKYPSWGASFDRRTKLPHRALGNPITYLAGANDPVVKAKAFLQQEFAEFNLPINEFVLTRNANDGKYIHVDFKQMHNGKDVLWSRITVRFTQDLRIVMFGIDAHRNIPNVMPLLNSAQATLAAENAITTTVLNSSIDANLVWFPFPSGNEFEYKQAHVVTVNTQDDKETPGKYVTYVDAVNGDILYRSNKVVHVGFNATADAYPTNLFSPLANLPLKNLLVNVVGSTTPYYTDLTGLVNVPGTTANVKLTLSGRFIKVVTGQSGTISPTYTSNGVLNGDVVNFPQSTPSATERHMTCYYHANEIHDFMKTKLPLFTTMDAPLTARVDRTDGNCNAFYDGSSINFYTTANGCNALSLISDVMYHEYGHGITDQFWAANGSNFANGGQGEGYSDVWAMSITKSPIIGAGFNVGAPNSSIREYNSTPKVYPINITGEVHNDGEIIAGAWWDFAGFMGGNLSTAIDTMATIFAESHYGLATGPDGTEGVVYHDILLDALQYDDNNNNIYDGTPHFTPIVKGFARHGIYLLNQTEMEHAPVGLTQVGSTVPIQTIAHTEFTAFLGNVKMFYRKKGTTGIDSTILVKSNDSVYTTNFNQTSTGGDVYEYYFTLYDNADIASMHSPIESRFTIGATQRNLPNFLLVGFKSMFLENFDNVTNASANWNIGGVAGDGVTLTSKGKWDVAIPISSKTSTGDFVQTGNDHTTGAGKCVLTGNASSASATPTNADVDNGKTTLITPAFDLTPYSKPVVAYWRWFTNSQGASARKDAWKSYASYNGGTSWFTLENTFQPDVNWRRNIFIPNLSQGTTIKFKFIATDTVTVAGQSGSLVEAALDDIEIFDIDLSPQAIHNVSTLSSAVYPNPTSNQLSILTNEQGLLNYTFLNAVGSLVQSASVQSNHQVDISTNQLANGIYFLRLSLNGKESIHKVSIIR
jgi:hypothetical protein